MRQPDAPVFSLAIMPTDPNLALPVMLLAAGRGERMRPLTDNTPKPLLRVHGKSLLQWRLEALQRDQTGPVLINTAWLGDQIERALGPEFSADGVQWPALPIRYSHEGRDFGAALETAGGIVRALDVLGDSFWVMAGDIFAPDFVFSRHSVAHFLASDALAHLWLVANPPHHPTGDFVLDPATRLLSSPPAEQPALRHTYSTIGLFRRELFLPPWTDLPAGNPSGQAAALAPLLRRAMAQGRITGEIYHAAWTDVGTVQRLADLNNAPLH